MPRYFMPIGRPAFIGYVTRFQDERLGLARPLYEYVRKDVKVEFDLENVASGPGDFGPDALMGCVTLGNDLNFWGFCCGGDWELPVFWIVYWDGRRIRGYVPTDGNPWNTTTKKAYGNDDAADIKNCVRRGWLTKARALDIENVDDVDPQFDIGAILADIVARITTRGKP